MCLKNNFYVVYNFYVDPSWRKKKITLKCQPENFAPAGKFRRSVQLLRRSEISRQRGNFYVVYNFYVDPSWRREEIIPKYQQDNFAPARQCPHCVQFLCRSELSPKGLIPMFQRDNFAPIEFEIQIEV